MNGRRVLRGASAALLVLAFGASSCGFRQPGRFLVEYPDADDADYAKTHPAPSVSDVRPKLALEAFSQKVADDILRTEQGRVLCNTAEARYFQIKAVYELEQNELALADRDLRRAEDALRVSCVPPAPPALPPVAMTHERGRRMHKHRVIRHRKHCKCK
jgi:hypothetical protein